MDATLLEKFGLSDNEIKVYEALLSVGTVPAGAIVQSSGLKRPTVYDTLHHLIKKGLVIEQTKQKVTHFQPAPPSKLFDLAEDKYRVLNTARKNLQDTLPQLMSAYLTTIERPVIQYYEGVQGIKFIYEDALKEKEPIFAIVQSEKINPELYDWFAKHYRKQLAKKHIKTQEIINDGAWTRQYVKQNVAELRETKIVSAKTYPFRNEIVIYGQKVAIINYKKEENLIGVLINHPLIAQTMQSWFQLTWDSIDKQYNQ